MRTQMTKSERGSRMSREDGVRAVHDPTFFEDPAGDDISLLDTVAHHPAGKPKYVAIERNVGKPEALGNLQRQRGFAAARATHDEDAAGCADMLRSLFKIGDLLTRRQVYSLIHHATPSSQTCVSPARS
ncbi:UNVERIFIED_ORG: hypothetical protein M2435_005177 [Rhizobium sophorae]|nr:hypothetical protein [Rhizobium leguminosarum]MDH6662254.1 hypothetical protein [Rhizobium sophorae]